VSIEQHITTDDNWFKHERKFLAYDVGSDLSPTGEVIDPIDLSEFAAGVEWQMSRTRGGPPILVKRSADVPPGIVITDGQADDDRARVIIEPGDVATFRAGTYFTSLRELDTGNVLSHGSAVLQDAGPPAPTP
jgi:hypothetical protein